MYLLQNVYILFLESNNTNKHTQSKRKKNEKQNGGDNEIVNEFLKHSLYINEENYSKDEVRYNNCRVL